MKLFLRKIIASIIPKISWITWNGPRALINGGVFFELKESDWNYLENSLAKNYYIILTRNASHLSTYLVSLGNYVATGKFGYWGHALMNLEGDNPTIDHGFKLMEATRTGVHYSSFMEVFMCDSYALLKPKDVHPDDWTIIMDKLLQQPGKKYDDLFDLANDKQLSCVELVRLGLQSLPDYSIRFANLEKMIKENGNNLTPEMFYDCPDFEIVKEVKN